MNAYSYEPGPTPFEIFQIVLSIVGTIAGILLAIHVLKDFEEPKK